MNVVTLTGRIVKDPEIRMSQGGVANCAFTLAVNRPYKDANGERQADFVNCVAWRNTAEYLKNYVKKGNLLGVQGRLQTRSYQGQDNQTHYVTEVVCDSIENMTPRGSDATSNKGVTAPASTPTAPVAPAVTATAVETPMTVEDDDLPF